MFYPYILSIDVFEATLGTKIMCTPQINLIHIIDDMVAILVFAFLEWISKFHILIPCNSFDVLYLVSSLYTFFHNRTWFLFNSICVYSYFFNVPSFYLFLNILRMSDLFLENVTHKYNIFQTPFQLLLDQPPTSSSPVQIILVVVIIIHQAQFVWLIYKWICHHSLEYDQPTRGHILKVNWFSSP